MRTIHLLMTLLTGFSLSFFMPVIFAAANPDSLIKACVKKNGDIRITDRRDNCDKNETFLEWNTQSPAASSTPINPPVLGSFIGTDLSSKDLTTSSGVNLAYRNFEGVNFSNSILYGAVFSYANIKNADFTGADLRSSTFDQSLLSGSKFTQANLDRAWLNSDLSDIDFSGANMSYVRFNSSKVDRTNFKNVDLSFVDLSGMQGFETANLEGVIWFYTICPDGTNSLDHDDTCQGHLNP